MDKVAIVILNWNGEQMLRKFLPSVIEHSSQAQIYVADNASTDDSLAMLKAQFPQVRLIVLDRNWGFAEGYNKALAEVEAEYFVLMNSDIEATSKWLEPLVVFMDSHKDVAACQPKLLSEVERGKFEYAGASGGFIDRYGYPFCRGRIFDVVEKDDGQYDDVCDVFWATGACLMIRAEDYWKAGGLDGRFFAHNEEIDLCWRLRLMGRRICCIPESYVYHVGGGTLPKGSSRKTYLNFRNNLTMLYKNLPKEELRRTMLLRWLLDYVAAWHTLVFNGNVGDFKAIYKARHSFRKWRKEFVDDRKKIQSSTVERTIPERRNISILWQYYVKKHKTYADLFK